MSKKAKGAGGRGQKGKGPKGAGAPPSTGEIRLSEHPRARHHIRLAKGWAGLAGCAFAGYASWRGGATFVDTALRALLWGVAAYVLVWFCAVQVWRQIAIAEVRAAEKQWRERRAEAERMARERAAQSQADRAAAVR
ncbi:MAG: hypothetical protein QOJ57_1487 [Thermoleophilaceae bacterium]|nr:hypothetical protein [Thermoleophilaceae bacterium]